MHHDMRGLVAVAPTRLDFGGGWTDVPPYPGERGGFVCSVAITRYAMARVAPSREATVNTARADFAPKLVRAALARHGESELSVTLTSDYPIGAGLGGSSAAGVALAAALRARKNLDVTTVEGRNAIAEASRAVEVEELGIPGGRQDHYAAAHGGALAIEFGEQTIARPIALKAAFVEALEARCLVAYTGESRMSGDTITAVLQAYTSGNRQVVDALDRMKRLAMQMRDAVAAGNVDALAVLVGEHWVHQRALHPGITTERIDALEREVTSAGAIGMKALGASGGGCVMVFARAGHEDRVRNALREFAEPLVWRVAEGGVTVREETGVMPSARRPAR